MISIRRRILLPLVPLTALALLATAWGIHEAVRRDLLAALDRTLLALAGSVAAAVDVELGGELEFEPEGPQVLALEEPGSEAFYVVWEEPDTVFEASLYPIPEPLPARSGEPAHVDFQGADGAYRVLTLPVERAPEDDEEDREEWLEDHPGEELPEPAPRRLWVTVAQRTRQLEETLSLLRTRLALGLGGLFGVLVLGPAWIVSRALRPLRRLSAQADAVGPDDPARRLDEAGVDREVHSLVAALNRALDRVTAAYQRQRRFTADAAHELRTPLSALRAHCEVALRKVRSADELREALQGVHRTALRMGGLVESLLALTRLQRADDFVVREPVDLAEIAREAAAVNRSAAAAKGVRLELQVPEPIPGRGDPALLVECVSNLVENAIRYTPAGGSVAVAARNGDQARIAVEDTGVGIPEDQLQRIFERFYRVDKARSRDAGGAGLGLPIAREIARLHGGEITVRSRVGEGTRFEFHLGSAAADPGRGEKSSPAGQPPG